MALTIKPDAVLDGVGYAAVLSPEGDPLGAVVVRPSKTMPGYVTLISSHEFGKAIRVPADWLAALEVVPSLDAPTSTD